eukprot:1252077-Rhodomonas_salina.1
MCVIQTRLGAETEGEQTQRLCRPLARCAAWQAPGVAVASLFGEAARSRLSHVVLKPHRYRV